MWLRVLLLITQLSLVMSTVIVITIDDEEQENQIAAIETKVNRLENISQAQNGTINWLNKVIHELHEQLEKHQGNTSENQQDQLDQLNDKIKGILSCKVKFEMHIKEHEANVSKTLQHQQKQIENLTKKNKVLQEDVQYIYNHTKGSYITCIYRMWENFGGRKFWRIWRTVYNSPKFYPPIFINARIFNKLPTDSPNFSSPKTLEPSIRQNFPPPKFSHVR